MREPLNYEQIPPEKDRARYDRNAKRCVIIILSLVGLYVLFHVLIVVKWMLFGYGG